MNKETNKNIPELRFTEFVEDGEWVEKTIGEVFNSFSGGTPNTSEKEYYGGEIPFIRSAEINKEETELLLTEEGFKNSSAKLVNKGDLLVALYGANSGDSAISKINGAINQAILCLQSEFSNSFTFYFLTLKKDWIVSRFIQGGQGNLSGDIVKSISIPFPKKQEQQKIASCLSSLDEVIAAHSQKLDLLKEHKKGLMQNLFPQEGETVPKYRFPEFVNDGEWKEKVLSKITDAIFDGTHQTPTYTDKGIPFFSVENIVSGNKNKFISKADYDLATNKNKPEKGDILLTRIGKIGYSSIIDWDYEFSIYVTLACIKKSMNFNSYFLHSYFQSDSYQTEIMSKSLLNAVPCKINMNELRETKILLPKPKEQQKIADCFSSLDALITAQAKKVEQLKLHKKGLMQGLFPKINE